jgi:hypothetical protein
VRDQRGQQFQILSSVPGMEKHEQFTASMGYYLRVRALRAMVADKRADLIKQHGKDSPTVALLTNAFAKTLRKELKTIEEMNDRRLAQLQEMPEAPKPPEVPADQVSLRLQWWQGSPPDARQKALNAAMSGQDPAFAAVLANSPWAFGLSETNHTIIKRLLNLEEPVQSDETRHAVVGATLLTEELQEFGAEINREDPDFKPPQRSRALMNEDERHQYLVTHGSAAYMALPE